MDYKKLSPEYVNQKLVYDENRVWFPNEMTKNGFKIGDKVWHVNKQKQLLSEFEIVVEKRFTEYTLSAPCKLFGRFREYFHPVERVTLKFLNGTKNSGYEYDANWFNAAMEFPFELITPDSKELRSLREITYRCTFKEADKLWAALNVL